MAKNTKYSSGGVAGKGGNVVVKNPKVKKKKPCCCRCLITFLIVFVIFVGAGAGAGWYFGDKYAKQYLDVGISDVLGTVSDVMSSNGKKIVTNSHVGTSAESFEGDLKTSLFLKSGADLKKSEIIDMLLNNNSGDDNDQAALTRAVLNATEGEGKTEDETEGESNALMNYLATLMTASNIDLASLESYTQENHSNYLLTLQDKNLAAFVSDLFETYIDDTPFAESMQTSLKAKLSEVLRLEQMIFYGTAQNPHIKVTLSLNARKIASNYINDLTGMKIGWLANPLLPKLFYFTADLSLKNDGESELRFFINNTDEAKMQRLYKIVKNATKLTGNALDIENMINEQAAPILLPIADALMSYGDLSKINEGKIKVDIFELAIEMAKLNDGKEGDDVLKSTELISTLKYILTSDFEDAIKAQHTGVDQYKNDSTLEVVYRPTSIDGYTLVDYEQELLDLLADRYLIDLENGTPDDTSDDRTFDDLMTLFGMGGGGSGDLMDWVDASRLGEISQRQEDISVLITDRMLGAMLNAQINSLMGDAGALTELSPRAYQVVISTSSGRTFMEAGIEINLKSYVGGSEVMSMIGDLLPEKVMLSIKVEITPDVSESYTYVASELYYNSLSREEVDMLLSTLAKLGIPLSANDLISPMETSLRDVINTMKKQMPGLAFSSSGILMTDVFTLTMDLEINKDKETNGALQYKVVDEYGNEVLDGNFDPLYEEMTGDDLKELIGVLYGDTDSTGFKAVATDHTGFLSDMVDKYFLDNQKVVVVSELPQNPDPSVHYVTTFDEFKAIFGMTNFNADLMDKTKLRHSNALDEDLRPIISDSELADIILGMMDGDEFADMQNIVSFEIKGDKIDIVVQVATKALFGDNDAFSRFITVEYIYVYITVDLADVISETDEDGNPFIYYKSTANINKMSYQDLSKMNALIAHYDSDVKGLNLDERAKDIGNFIYTQLDSFKESMGNRCDFEDGGVKIANIFDLIAQSTPYDHDSDPDTDDIAPSAADVRGALQGMSSDENVEWTEEFSVYNYNKDMLVFNLPQAFSGIGDLTTVGTPPTHAVMADNQLAYALKNGLTSDSLTVVQDATLEQVNLYTAGRSLPQAYGVDGYDQIKDYAVFTFALTNWGATESNNYTDLIESAIYFTLIFERNGDDFVISKIAGENAIIVNELSTTQQDVLFSIAKVDTTAFNEQITNCEDALGTILEGNFSTRDIGGSVIVGTVQIPLANINIS